MQRSTERCQDDRVSGRKVGWTVLLLSQFWKELVGTDGKFFGMDDLTLCQVRSAYPVAEVVCHCLRVPIAGWTVQE